MTTTLLPIRIAVVFGQQEFSCRPVTLPFSLEGYPPVEIEVFGPGGQPRPPSPRRQLPELRADRYDLVLDGEGLAADLPEFKAAPNLVSGPAARFFEGLVCQMQELRQKQEINAGIIHSATDGLITIDEKHRVIGYNRGAEEIFGFPRKEVLGQDLKVILPPYIKEVHGQYLARYLATREAHVLGRQRRLLAQRRDGQEFPMSIAFSVVEIHGHLYFTAIVRDITEYKAMEDRVLHSERLAAVGNTVTHIAHEIKNPLLIIGGFARQILKTQGLDEMTRQQLTTIAEEVRRLEQLVAEMRDFVQRPPAQKKPGEIAPVILQVMEDLRDTLQEQQVTVRRVEETPLPPLLFDPRQMQQVLFSLCRNALEAMPRGGQITITSRTRGAQVEISIADTGEGMSPQVLDSLFQPFFTTKEKGAGLGLAICQSIIQEHGGHISVSSTPGRGSTFTIQLPVEETAAM